MLCRRAAGPAREHPLRDHEPLSRYGMNVEQNVDAVPAQVRPSARSSGAAAGVHHAQLQPRAARALGQLQPEAVRAAQVLPRGLGRQARPEGRDDALRQVRAIGLDAGEGLVAGEEQVAFGLARNPERPEGVDLGALATAGPVPAIPDPGADHRHPVAGLGPGEERQRALLALDVHAAGRLVLPGEVAAAHRSGAPEQRAVGAIREHVQVQVVAAVDGRQVLGCRMHGELALVPRDDQALEPSLRRRRPGGRGVPVTDVGPRRDRLLRLREVVAAAAVRPRVDLGIDRHPLPRGRRQRRRKPRAEDGEREDDDAAPHRRITTGVPAGVTSYRRRSTGLRTRMQPFETACPIDQGSFVPWIAIGPPCVQPVSTVE